MIAAAAQNLAFYETTAQIVPLLFIVAAIEMRILDPMAEPSAPRWLRVLRWPVTISVFAWPLLAEVSALYVLDTGRPTARAEGIIWSALSGQAFTILLLLGFGWSAKTREVGRLQDQLFQLQNLSHVIGGMAALENAIAAGAKTLRFSTSSVRTSRF